MSLAHGSDGIVRGVYVRVVSNKGHIKTLRRPLQHIYLLEAPGEPAASESASSEIRQDCSDSIPDSLLQWYTDVPESPALSTSAPRHPFREAATEA